MIRTTYQKRFDITEWDIYVTYWFFSFQVTKYLTSFHTEHEADKFISEQ